MWFQLLSLFDFWFWIITSVFGIFEFIYVSKRKPWSTLTTLIIFLLILTFFSDINIFARISDNWLIVVEILGIGLGIGIFWAVVRWYLYLKKRLRIYESTRIDFYKEFEIPNATQIKDLPNHQRESLVSRVEVAINKEFHEDSYKCIVKPKAKNNIDLIAIWIAWWGFDMIIWAFRDFLRDFFRVLALSIQAIFQKISDRVFRKYANDFNEDGSIL